MKKVLAICLVMLMAVSMSVYAFAAPEGFVSSPSGKTAPTVVTFDPKDENCTAQLVITPYASRDDLSAEEKASFEKAYADIADSKDLTKLNGDLAKLAQDKKIAAEDLAISDLFNIHTTHCEDHDGHLEFDVVLKGDALKNFVGLMYMDKDGNWVLVKNAQVENDGTHLKFTLDSLDASTPFAIVVDTGVDAPQTDDNSNIHIYLIIMAVSALALVAVGFAARKKAA